MSIDLIQMIKGAASDAMMKKMGGALGMEPKKTSSVFDMASAALLGGIMKKASTPDGAKSVLDLAKNTDFSVLDKLGDLVGGSGPAADAFQKSGGSMLDSLLGGGKSSMMNTLSKALGLDSSTIGKLLSMIAPIVMSVLGKQVMSSGLDAAGLGNLLGSQKKSLAGFLPANLTQDLGLGNMLGDVGKAASAATNQARGAVKSAGAAGEQAAGGLAKILIPLLLIGALGFVLWKYVLTGANNVVEGVNNVATSGADALKGAAAKTGDAMGKAVETVTSGLPSFDMDLSALGENGNTLKTGFTDITSGLAGLANAGATEETAKGLMEKISGLAGKVDGMGLDKLDGIAKTASSGLIGSFLGSIDGLLEKVPAPLRTIIEPAIKGLIEKLSPFK